MYGSYSLPRPASFLYCLYISLHCKWIYEYGGRAARVNSSTEVHRQLSRAHSLDLIIHHKVTIEVFPRWGLVTKSRPTLATPWTVASQAPLPMGFSRQEYWSGLPFPSPIPKGPQSNHQDIQHTQEFQCLLLTVLAPKHP